MLYIGRLANRFAAADTPPRVAAWSVAWYHADRAIKLEHGALDRHQVVDSVIPQRLQQLRFCETLLGQVVAEEVSFGDQQRRTADNRGLHAA